MKRLWHYVRDNANSETLYRCIFVDTETDNVVLGKGKSGHKLRFGWACYTGRNETGKWTKPQWKRFTDFTDFWLWAVSFTRPKSKTWIWCLNAAFDYPVLHAFTHLPDIGWKIESAILDSPPTIVRYSLGKHSLVLCDTLNIWLMSAYELGEKCGLPKLDMPEKFGDQEVDDAYCIRDVEIIRKSVCDWSDFLRDNDLGGFAPTIAAQSMRTFRHRYLADRILIENNDLSLGLARNCYHGGRVEAGYIGELKQPVHSLDVNSMYPYVMSYAEMPLRLVGCSRYVQPYQLAQLLQRYCLCAHVRVNTKEPFAAIVREGKLTFPIGRFDAYLCTPEIRYAQEAGCIEEVYLCATYEKGEPFRRFALDLYGHKERAAREGRKFEADHWKKLLNSFYGKWGQSGRKWVQTGVCDVNDFWCRPTIDAQTLKKSLVRHFGGITFERADDGESSESHPAIAAHITAEARMVLWALIRQLAPQDYFYCDTDGLLVSDNGLETLRDSIDQHALGKIKHVKTYEKVRIYGCKDYVLDGEERIKGVSKKADRLDNGSYRQLRWASLRGLLREASLDMPLTTVVDKTLRRTYTKGTVLPSGFVVPLHLEE